MKITFEAKASSKADVTVIFADAEGHLNASARAFDKDSSIKRAVKLEEFKGKKGNTLVLPGAVVAAVPKTHREFEKTGNALFRSIKGSSAQVLLGKVDAEDAAILGAGILLNSYKFAKYLTKEKKPGLKSVTIVVDKPAEARKAFDKQRKLADAVFLTRDLVSEPPNVLYPESFAAIIKKELSPLGVEVKILGRKEIKKLGMNALAGVGQGSDRPEQLVTMHYKGGAKTQKNIAFVGKGVTFDTGGISLKPGAGMDEMKWDMAGAGVVVGLMKSLAARRAKVNVVGVVALAENMPSGGASRPGDIVYTMSGQTVENLNTDAEGRLILCDALWYTQEKFKPTQIVDLATLTGAMIQALGHEYAGCFSNNDKLGKDLIAAGNEVGEYLWPMPLHDQWDKALDSVVADIKNIAGAGVGAGSAIGAHFLKRFIQKGVHWAHLDIAGMAWAYRDKLSAPKGASAFGVRLLDRYVEKFCE